MSSGRLPWWFSSKGSTCNAGDVGLIPGMGRFPGERNGNPPVFLPEKPHGQRSLVSYSPWGHKELDTTEWLNTQTHQVPLNLGGVWEGREFRSRTPRGRGGCLNRPTSYLVTPGCHSTHLGCWISPVMGFPIPGHQRMTDITEQKKAGDVGQPH